MAPLAELTGVRALRQGAKRLLTCLEACGSRPLGWACSDGVRDEGPRRLPRSHYEQAPSSSPPTLPSSPWHGPRRGVRGSARCSRGRTPAPLRSACRPARRGGARAPCARVVPDNTKGQGFKDQETTHAPYGRDLERRKPRLLTRELGPAEPRFAARALCATLPHDPPRSTRFEPVVAPVGLLTFPG